eukprot:SAG22_NODE_1802_length_3535_cov_2.147846_1_plen_619_part_00
MPPTSTGRQRPPAPRRPLAAPLFLCSCLLRIDTSICFEWHANLVADLAATLPEGFDLTVYAEVPAARSLALSSTGSGIVYVSGYPFSGIQGLYSHDTAVYGAADADGDGAAEILYPVTEKMDCPNGIATLNGDLYVAQKDRILRYPQIEAGPPADRRLIRQPQVLLRAESTPGAKDGLPQYSWHAWRYLTADAATDTLYVAVGAPCNVPGDGEIKDCARPPFAAIAAVRATSRQTHQLRVVARGVRNTVGMTIKPGTRELWFSDNGRDDWGSGGGVATATQTQDNPPCELNVLDLGQAAAAPPAVGQAPDYGFPRCYGKDTPDPAGQRGTGQPFNPELSCDPYVPAAVELPAHAAPLGLRWYTNASSAAPYGFPAADWAGRLIVAEHGSWNRRHPSGYRVVSYEPGSPSAAAGGAAVLLDFRLDPPLRCNRNSDCPYNASCQTHSGVGAPFFCGGIGRPADVEVLADGSVLVTDELNSLVYSVAYNRPPPPCLPGEELELAGKAELRHTRHRQQEASSSASVGRRRCVKSSPPSPSAAGPISLAAAVVAVVAVAAVVVVAMARTPAGLTSWSRRLVATVSSGLLALSPNLGTAARTTTSAAATTEVELLPKQLFAVGA